MAAAATVTQTHALLVPFPTSGFLNPTLHLARLLHSGGVPVTILITEHNHSLFRARGHGDGVQDGFRYEVIPDGLGPSDRGSPTYGLDLARAVRVHCGEPLRELILRLNRGDDASVPPVTCVVASQLMSFALDVAAGLGIPAFMLWTEGACGLALRELRLRGLVPLKVTEETPEPIDFQLPEEAQEELQSDPASDFASVAPEPGNAFDQESSGGVSQWDSQPPLGWTVHWESEE